MIYLGTSGFSYADWKGHFYPNNISAKEMLAFYSLHFTACEINSTYYQPFPYKISQSMVNKSRQRVNFVVKLHKNMTHARSATTHEFALFFEGLKPFLESGVLGGLLAQFPNSFDNRLEHRGYLADLKAHCMKLDEETPVFVEFRHPSWQQPSIPALLGKWRLDYVNVDEPALKNLMEPSAQVTNKTGYVRFHGRNREAWFKRGLQPWERYDYLYSEAELREWVPRIQSMENKSERVFAFFNNHWQSKAATNSLQMASLLNAPGMGKD